MMHITADTPLARVVEVPVVIGGVYYGLNVLEFLNGQLPPDMRLVQRGRSLSIVLGVPADRARKPHPRPLPTAVERGEDEPLPSQGRGWGGVNLRRFSAGLLVACHG